MGDWLADRLLTRPGWTLLLFAAITAGFAVGLPQVEIRTIFNDLLPTDDPLVDVYREHPNFGNPLTMIVMVRRTDGDIYNPETLGKVWQLTRDIDLAPGVDHAQIMSIATEKARFSQATAYGVDMRPLMDDARPTTPEDIANFRQRVEKSPNVRTFLISAQQDATLISATFIEQKVDWGEAFEYVQGLVEAARDEHHEVHLTGRPALIGWVYRHEWEMAGVFMLTLSILVLALALNMRSLVGVLTPVITAATAAIWAFGFVGHLNIAIEPLLLVVPLLLIARSFSHGVQFTSRFQEYRRVLPDRNAAARATLKAMLKPSMLSITTDVLGIVVVVAAPIPAMVNHAIFCGFWALWLIPTGVLMMAPLLAVLPDPRRDANGENIHALKPLLTSLAGLVTGPHRFALAAVMLAITALAWWTSAQIRIGNPVPGSNLLWQESEFNTAVRAINRDFPGTNTLEIVLEARDPDSDQWTTTSVDAVQTMQRLQLAMESSAMPPRATLSFADYLADVNRLFNGGDPRWLPLDPRERALSAAAVGAMMGASSTAYSHVVSDTLQHGTVSLWYADNTQETVDAVLAAATAAVNTVGVEHDDFRVRLGTGTIAIQEAINRIIARYHHIVVGLLNLAIFLLATLAFRSAVAGLLLLAPVNLAHLCMIACMHLLGVGLDVNSMIVAAIGLGVGIDYGIYLVSRVQEELAVRPDDWVGSLRRSLTTSGQAIAFTASIMTIAILPLYLLSGLKFVADMGLLIMAIMAINMMSALVVLPLLIALLRPRFLQPRPRDTLTDAVTLPA